MRPQNAIGFHEQATLGLTTTLPLSHPDTQFTYTFRNFFHPFVGELLSKLNSGPLSGIFDAGWQESLKQKFFEALYKPTKDEVTLVESFLLEIDLADHGSYANYNWELFFHVPLTVAVHLSKTQRFAEAQRWFHYIFDPTSADTPWKFLAFRKPDGSKQIDEVIRLLSTPKASLSSADQQSQEDVLNGYRAILDKPFQPHAVARTRLVAYQYCTVMKYLDNLIAWGDSLFQQDTVESINEATMHYVLAANLLGPRPQRIPPRGAAHAKTFKQLKDQGLGPIGNALVELEGQFPFNHAPPPSDGSSAGAGPLFGIGQTLYFCLPPNDKLLGYWDAVADRLFKIRHCMNIAGVVRPLALFDPPLDPGMLVKAAAAGIDVGSIVNGLNQPVGPVRCLTLIQKALELCNEVRSLGGALLSALEKGDGEHLALLRQGHEIKIQQMAQEVRFLQWKAAEEATKSLLTNRATALERLRYYQRALGLLADQNAPPDLQLDHSELTEENFDEAYDKLVGQYDKQLTLQDLPALKLAGDASPAQHSGAAGGGNLYLNTNENADLNIHGPQAHAARLNSMAIETLHAPLAFVPEVNVDMEFWGLGAHATVFGGSMLVNFGHFLSSVQNIVATEEEGQAVRASKTAGYQRRADEWLLQYNLAAHELMQVGRQILTSMIAEQIAHHEYLNVQQQIANAQEVDEFLRDKFTGEELYLWMQGEVSRLYYDYYRFAFDTARKAERTMKQELMRPELDAQDFVKFNYWDGGRKGLLSGETLHLDVKRMELAYHENNRREFELTRHVSLRQLDPLALLKLKTTGTCRVAIPEWLYDRDCPGHYMRRIKTVAVSLPSVVGPYTSVNCTLSLLRSSLRKSPLLKDNNYARQGADDERFVDYLGSAQAVVTSAASNDAGLFETNLRDERFLPFEGAGAESTWQLDLPAKYPAFDYATISDVILHVRYTAQQGVDPQKVTDELGILFQQVSQSNLALLFSLRHDFPTELAAFVNGTGDFTAAIRNDFFPYFAQDKTIKITALELCVADASDPLSVDAPTARVEWDGQKPITSLDGNNKSYTLTAGPAAPLKLTRPPNARVFLLIRYSFS